MRSLLGRCCLILAVVTATVGCDGVTKHMAVEHLAGLPTRSVLADTIRVGYAENRGGFLGLGEDLPESIRTALFSFATGAFLVLLAGFAWRTGWQGWRAVAVALFVAGGFSNWVDRLGDGRVVDFLNVGVGGIRTGIFNFADVAILSSIVLYLSAEYIASRRRRG
jgi:signal peptidase II